MINKMQHTNEFSRLMKLLSTLNSYIYKIKISFDENVSKISPISELSKQFTEYHFTLFSLTEDACPNIRLL